MNVRNGREEDLDQCIALSRIPEFTFVHKRTDNEIKQYLKEFLKKGIFIVVEQKKEIIGYLIAEYLLGKHAWIDGITVKKEERRKGIGKQLVTQFKKHIRNKKVKHIYLMAPTKNKNTIKFYQSLGMEKGEKFVEFLEDL